MAVYDRGDTLTLGNCTAAVNARAPATWEAFTNLLGAAADPTTVVLRVRKPDGTTTAYTYGGTPALQKESTGRYYVHVALDQEGWWHAELEGTGAVAAAYRWAWFVSRDEV